MENKLFARRMKLERPAHEQSRPNALRYTRKLEPWEYSPPWWMYLYAAALIYLIFA